MTSSCMSEGVNPQKIERGVAMLAAVGPIFFGIVSSTLGTLQGFGPGDSRLGEVGGPNAIFWNAGVVVLGASTVALSFLLPRALVRGKGPKIASALLTLAAIGYVGVGIFSCDPGCPSSGSLSNTLHRAIAPVQNLWIVAALIISLSLRKDPVWKGLSAFSMGAVVMVLGIGAGRFLFQGSLGPEWRVALSTLQLATALVWLEVMAISLLRLSFRQAVSFPEPS